MAKSGNKRAAQPYSFDGLIRKQVRRGFGKRATISGQTVRLMDCLLRDFQDEVFSRAAKVAQRKGRATINEGDLMLAVTDVTPPGMRKLLAMQREPKQE